MSLPTVTDATYPTPAELLAQFLTDVRYAYARIGVAVNVEPGSELYMRGQAFANVAAVAIANNKLARDAGSPLTASGQDLVDLAGVFGVTKRPASKSAGSVVAATQKLTSTTWATVTIPAGFEWTSAAGVKCTVDSDSTVTNGETVAVQTSTSGASTAIAGGTGGQWSLAAVGYLVQAAAVAPGGITGGHDEDSPEVLRQRLLRKLSRPAVGGNSAHVQSLAEGASSAISEAFVYQAVRGPSSYDVALCSSSGDRTVAVAVQNAAASAILAEMPGSADLNVTTVYPELIDAVVNVRLPLPQNAGGAGGGFYDATPYPSSADASTLAKITVVAGNVVTVNSTAADIPTVGARVAIWDPTALAFNHYTIAAVGGAPGAYTVSLDALPGSSVAFITTNMRLSADCVRLDTYGAAYLAAMLACGPGEKTTSPDILPRGRRVVGADVSAPGEPFLSTSLALAIAGPEVLLVGQNTYTTATTTPQTAPSVPATTALAPRILVLKHLSFRRLI